MAPGYLVPQHAAFLAAEDYERCRPNIRYTWRVFRAPGRSGVWLELWRDGRYRGTVLQVSFMLSK